MSDIHFEVDMALPCFGSKAGWFSVHKAIVAAVEIRKNKGAFVLCKNFHMADQDLVQVFSSFMASGVDGVDLRYILVTEHLSHIPYKVSRLCKNIAVPLPRSATSKTLRDCPPCSPCLEEAAAVAALNAVRPGGEQSPVAAVRHAIYAGLTRNMNVSEWSWHLFRAWKDMCDGRDQHKKDIAALDALIVFNEQYTRSYRPVFHLERLAFSLGTLLHGPIGSNEGAGRARTTAS